MKINTKIKQLENELLHVVKRYSGNEEVTINTLYISENHLQIQVIIAGKNRFDITLNSFRDE
jgi:septum formation topological specificity factor MinE